MNIQKMPFIAFAAVLALVTMPANAQLAHPAIHADTTTANRVITHMVAGGGWNTAIVLVNLGSTPAAYTLLFYRDSGGAQPFPFEDTDTQKSLGNQSTLSGMIPVGGRVSLKAQDVSSTTTTGWASIDPNSTGDIGALVTFGYKTGQQAVVPVETATTTRFILAFDNSGGNVMGVALVNPHSRFVGVNVLFRDLNGLTLLSQHIEMAPQQHMSFILASQYPVLAGHVGTALFTTDSSDQAVAALGILANKTGAYTTVFTLAAE